MADAATLGRDPGLQQWAPGPRERRRVPALQRLQRDTGARRVDEPAVPDIDARVTDFGRFGASPAAAEEEHIPGEQVGARRSGRASSPRRSSRTSFCRSGCRRAAALLRTALSCRHATRTPSNRSHREPSPVRPGPWRSKASGSTRRCPPTRTGIRRNGERAPSTARCQSSSSGGENVRLS